MRSWNYCLLALSLSACDDSAAPTDASTDGVVYAFDSAGLSNCTGLADCRLGEVCHRTGVCVPDGFCTDGADCASGQTCGAASHRCVVTGRCMVEGDCPTGQRCSPGSRMCLANGRCGADSDCTTGQTCNTTTGQCAIGMGCGRMVFNATRVAPNVMIVLDRSGSMSEDEGGTTRWDIAKRAIETVTTRFDSTIRFGLTTYSACVANGCSAGRVVVPLADRNAGAINTFLRPLVARGSATGAAPNYLCDTAYSETSTGVTLQALVGNAMLQDAARANAVLLVTDGVESEDCVGMGRPNGATAAGRLFTQSRPVRTYAVGVSNDVSATELRAIATSGGTMRSFQANNTAQLVEALNSIAQDIGSCDMTLDQAAPDPSMIYVYFNRDPAGIMSDPTNGWTYNPTTRTLHFSGTSCMQLRSNAVTSVDVVYGCGGGIPG